MENALDIYSISFITLLGISITILICLALLRLVKYLVKSYKKNEQRKARKKMRMLRNDELIKRKQNISAIL